MNKSIGRFDILGELGRGAQSVVYLAFDPHLAREVAIKTLHFAHPDPQQNADLLDEARAVSKLAHPGIVTIFEAGEEDGDVFLVFEYVAGENLAMLLRRHGALPSAKAANLMSEVLDAVGHAHEHGIIHRDLKPSNILIDKNGRPKVMDFGIAAHTGQGGASSTTFTGTPAYMPPEYITQHAISEQQDVFAAGLILFEIVTGKRAIVGKDGAQVMRQIADEGFVLPATEIPLDDQLARIIMRATERHPQDRYKNAREFHQALEAYLLPEVRADDPDDDGEMPAAVDFLLRRLLHKGDFPALSESVRTINALASSDTDGVSRLSDVILRDFALTNKLLRMVNSVYYRPAGGKISTVSNAIILLGFNAVRDIAVAGLLFEHMQNKEGAWRLKEEFLHANIAGLLARNLARALEFPDEEQHFICAIFHNLGRFLSQYYFPEESEVVRKFMTQKKQTEQCASRDVLGVSFEALGVAIANHWGFPALITDSMRHGEPPEEDTPEAKRRALVMFSNALCEGRETADIARTRQRFAKALPISEELLCAVLRDVAGEAGELARSIRIDLQHSDLGCFITEAWQTKEEIDEDPTDRTQLVEVLPPTVARLPETVPAGVTVVVASPEKSAIDRQAMLLAGIQEISAALIAGKPNDIFRIALDCLYRALDFSHVILCMRDPDRETLRGRSGFGHADETFVRRFSFRLTDTPDIFQEAVEKGEDILVCDVDAPAFASRIPAWYRGNFSARSFLLLPLRVRQYTVGLIYADSDRINGALPAEKELALLCALRNQAALALIPERKTGEASSILTGTTRKRPSR